MPLETEWRILQSNTCQECKRSFQIFQKKAGRRDLHATERASCNVRPREETNRRVALSKSEPFHQISKETNWTIAIKVRNSKEKR